MAQAMSGIPAYNERVTNAAEITNTPHGGIRSGGQAPTTDPPADEDTFVVVDGRGRQINRLPVMMTVAKALEDALI